MSIVTPLHGHTSLDTAFQIDSYPYGFKLRCKMRCWLETDAKRGVRFMTQTTNPKKPIEVWNKPKASTYAFVTGAMYLDENGHVQWAAISEYQDHAKALEFARNFGGGVNPKRFQDWTAAKVRFYQKLVDGTAQMVTTVNGVEVVESDARKAADLACNVESLNGWKIVADALEEKLGMRLPAQEATA